MVLMIQFPLLNAFAKKLISDPGTSLSVGGSGEPPLRLAPVGSPHKSLRAFRSNQLAKNYHFALIHLFIFKGGI